MSPMSKLSRRPTHRSHAAAFGKACVLAAVMLGAAESGLAFCLVVARTPGAAESGLAFCLVVARTPDKTAARSPLSLFAFNKELP
jgi:hypothetical protein